MRTHLSLLAGVAALAAVIAASGARAQPFTPEEVVAVMKGDTFVTFMNACAQGQAVPGTVKIELIIDENGGASLAATDPVADPVPTGCFAKAVSTLKFRAAGQKFKIIYNFTFQVQAAPPVVLQPIPPAAAQPPAAAPPPSADSEIPPSYDQDEGKDWEAEYRKGRTMVAAGAVLTALGGGAIAGMLIYLMYTGMDCANGGGCNEVHPAVILGCLFGGGALLGAGIPVLAIGASKRSRAKKHLGFSFQGFGLAPTRPSGGAVLSLGWNFM
jgi:hypothetical protein